MKKPPKPPVQTELQQAQKLLQNAIDSGSDKYTESQSLKSL